MKNVFLALILTIALICLFSIIDYRQPLYSCISYTQCHDESIGNSFGTKQKGDSNLILPGTGESLVNTSIADKFLEEQLETEPVVGSEAIKTTTTERLEEMKIDSNEFMEEIDKMVITDFWQGIIAVLIGEASALLVAFACKRLWRNNQDNTKRME